MCRSEICDNTSSLLVHFVILIFMSNQQRERDYKDTSMFFKLNAPLPVLPMPFGFFSTAPSLHEVRQLLPGMGMCVSMDEFNYAATHQPWLLSSERLARYAEGHVMASVDTKWVAARYDPCYPLSACSDLGDIGNVAYISLLAGNAGFKAKAAFALKRWRANRQHAVGGGDPVEQGAFVREPSVYILHALPNGGVQVSDQTMHAANCGYQVYDMSVDELCALTEVAVMKSVDMRWVARKYANCALSPCSDIGVVANVAYVAHYAKSVSLRQRAFNVYAQWRECTRLHYGTDCTACSERFTRDMDHKHTRCDMQPNQRAHYGQCATDPDFADDEDATPEHGLNSHDNLLGRSVTCTIHELQMYQKVSKKRKRDEDADGDNRAPKRHAIEVELDG